MPSLTESNPSASTSIFHPKTILACTVAIALGIAIGFLVRRAQRTALGSHSRSSSESDSGADRSSKHPSVASSGQVACTPKFLAEVPKDVEVDPTAPGYDPGRLLGLSIPADEMYRREPRRATWAAGMEAGVGHDLIRDLQALVPELVEPRVECRTMMCSVSWKNAGDEVNAKVKEAVKLTGVAPSISSRYSEDGRAGLLLLYRPAENYPSDQPELAQRYNTGRPEQFREDYKNTSRERFASVRSGKRRLPPGLSIGNLPQ